MKHKDIIGKRVELIEDGNWVAGRVKAGSKGTVESFGPFITNPGKHMYHIVFDKKKPKFDYVFGFTMPFNKIRFLDEEEMLEEEKEFFPRTILQQEIINAARLILEREEIYTVCLNGLKKDSEIEDDWNDAVLKLVDDTIFVEDFLTRDDPWFYSPINPNRFVILEDV